MKWKYSFEKHNEMMDALHRVMDEEMAALESALESLPTRTDPDYSRKAKMEILSYARKNLPDLLESQQSSALEIYGVPREAVRSNGGIVLFKKPESFILSGVTALDSEKLPQDAREMLKQLKETPPDRAAIHHSGIYKLRINLMDLKNFFGKYAALHTGPLVSPLSLEEPPTPNYLRTLAREFAFGYG